MIGKTGSPHLTEAELRDLAGSRGRGEGAAHLASCAGCRDAVATLRDLRGAIAPGLADRGGDCPEPKVLLQLADGAPAARPDLALATHLRSCLDCALEVEGLLRLRDTLPEPPVLSRTAPRAASLLARLRALVEFELPAPVVLQPRSAGARSGSPAYRQAMNAYRRGRLDEACTRLRRARSAGDRSPGLNLYLGAALLAVGRPAAAVPVLEAAASERRGAGESRWYLAQALLRRGKGPEALAELRRAARLAGPRREAARDLAARIASVLGESRTDVR